jgi:hypothetical protein
MSRRLDWSLCIVLRENREHDSHIIVVMKFHVGVCKTFVWAMILDIGHPSCIAAFETTIELVQLVLHIAQCNMDVDPNQICVSLIVVDCS